ncbi:MAG: ABC transporter substrate-binding protein [Phycisphaerae bacterium]|nr:ABC transporter substrate-binding protein [Phycisphaerae bacterium]MCZ2399470.1 ABC transporter substrate-binding protein [Phycisphaerae bacterium]NUQ48729.1 ABC transporter substrate-binding protein [Phycisphaerae bacterium]
MNRWTNATAGVLALGAMVCVSLGVLGGGRQPGGAGQSGRKLVVGFAQIGAESAWRTANTESIKSEAARRGIELRFSDAQQKQENQIRALRTFIAQGVDVIAFAPVVETGWEPVLREVKQAGIPVILTDRTVDVSDDSLFVTFIGADFVEEGRRAARWLAKATGGKALIAELQGTPGAAPAIDRKKGFEEALREHPEMRIVKSQSGDFTRAKGKEVMEAFLKSPEGRQITAVYAHNDDMALGAIQALDEAGRNPGKDVLIVSIDGVRGAFEAMIAGKLNCTVECNPLIGPLLFDTVEAVAAGKTVPRRIVTPEAVFEQAQAAEAIKARKY